MRYLSDNVGDSRWGDGETVSLGIAYGNALERPVGRIDQILTSRGTSARGSFAS